MSSDLAIRRSDTKDARRLALVPAPVRSKPVRLSAETMRLDWLVPTDTERMLADYITYAATGPLLVWALASSPWG
jgi:hypothetical protein